MTFLSAKVKCPYYCNDTGKSIICEGIFSRFNVQNFKTKEKLESYAIEFCAEKYQNCPIWQLNEKKYERDM